MDNANTAEVTEQRTNENTFEDQEHKVVQVKGKGVGVTVTPGVLDGVPVVTVESPAFVDGTVHHSLAHEAAAREVHMSKPLYGKVEGGRVISVWSQTPPAPESSKNNKGSEGKRNRKRTRRTVEDGEES